MKENTKCQEFCCSRSDSFSRCPVGRSEFTEEERGQVLDEWNKANVEMCNEVPKYGIDEWPDFKTRNLRVLSAMFNREIGWLHCLYHGASDGQHFVFLWHPNGMMIATRLGVEDVIGDPPQLASAVRPTSDSEPQWSP